MEREPAARDVKLLFAWRLAIRGSELPSSARLVAHTLATYMNVGGGSAFPGVSLLAQGTGLSVRTVQTHLQLLRETGYLVYATNRAGNRKVGGGREAAEYQAMIPRAMSPNAHSADATPATVAPLPVNVDDSTPATVAPLIGNERRRPLQPTTSTPATVAPQVSQKQDRRKPGSSGTSEVVSAASTVLTPAAAPQRPAATVFADDPPPSVAEQARAIVNPWWESTPRKPMGGYMAVVKRVEEALDAGYPPEAIAAVLPSMRAFTRNCFDWALRSRGETLAPATWDTIRSVMEKRRKAGEVPPEEPAPPTQHSRLVAAVPATAPAATAPPSALERAQAATAPAPVAPVDAPAIIVVSPATSPNDSDLDSIFRQGESVA